MEDGNASDDRLTRMEATLHAMAARPTSDREGPTGGYKGLGAKMQTKTSGYNNRDRGGGGAEAVVRLNAGQNAETSAVHRVVPQKSPSADGMRSSACAAAHRTTCR